MKFVSSMFLIYAGFSLALAACSTTLTDPAAPLPPPSAPPPPPVVPPPAPLALVLSVNPPSRRATAQPGTPAPGDNATVSLSGDHAATTTWTAQNRHPWIVLLAATGTGSGSATWMRNTAGLVAGFYVDTITITAPGATGSPAVVIDTLQLTAAPVPLVLSVSPASRRATAMQGSVAPGDNIAIGLTGDAAISTTWSITKRSTWATVTPVAGTGSGSATWTRSIAGMFSGTYVDTMTVTAPGAAGSPFMVLDTLIITPPLVMQLAPASIRTSVVSGSTASATAAVTFSGTGAATASWAAAARKLWTTLTMAAGTGNGTIAWSHNAAALGPGTYVDTISVVAVAAVGSPASVIDTLVVTPAPVPLSLNVSPRSASTTAPAGSAAAGASAAVTLSGDNAASAPWSASKRTAWVTLTTASGTGSGAVAWSHTTTGLAAGTYVDTITVTASGALNSPMTMLDTLVITPVVSGGPDLGLNADLHGKMLFPASNLWNRPVDTAQVDPSSSLILGTIGLGVSLHPDFGANYNGAPFGIPYIVVPDATPRVSVPFTYADESDPGPYPIPANPPIEPGGGDSHLLVVTQNEWKLYELYALFPNGSGGWTAGSGAIWDLATGAPRPAGWTSADAAGLPILLGLVRYDEVYLHGEIDHALRFTVQHTRASYVAPASHVASSSSNLAYAPMGMRVRLKASFDISGYSPQAQVVLRALKKYGMIVADNGSNFYLSGTADARWNDNVNNTLKQVKVGDFEVVRMDGVVTP
jgi:hypothetical protein